MIYQYNKNILSLKCRCHDSLTKIYGIGKTRAFVISIYLGSGFNTNVGFLNRYLFEVACVFFNSFSIIDSKMAEKVLLRLQLYYDTHLYRGSRLKLGLPLHGQRTHSNARTSRRLKIKLNEKED